MAVAAQPKTPFYYFRLDNGYVALISHAAMLDELKKSKYRSPKDPSNLWKAILGSPELLRENRDLFAYILAEPSVRLRVSALVVELLKSGRASVIDDGGISLENVYVELDRQETVSYTRVKIGEAPEAPTLILSLDCIVAN